MDRKIFISINIPERAKKRLSKAILPWEDLPVKWIKEENYHITLAYLGHVNDALLGEICEKVRQATENVDIFDLEFERIEIGPSLEDPRIVWLTGKASDELLELHEKIEKALGTFVAERKTFIPHITLGKIRKHKWEALKTKPEISLKLSLPLPVETVAVMASDFSGSSSAYTIIADSPLAF
jgi:2'-5' RNA ligase